MCKQNILLDDIHKWHPFFRGISLKRAKSYSDVFNVEVMIELAMAEASEGLYKWIPGDHEDFTDGSDSKTGTISDKVVVISKVCAPSGKQKNGALRCVFANYHTEKPMYYYIPKSWWIHHYRINKTDGYGYITLYYRKGEDRIDKIEQFRVKTFEELCRKTD